MNAVTYDTTKVMNDTYLNSDSVCEGLEKLRKKYPDRILYIILDNAAYQRCNKVAEKAKLLNINLVFLPPYSPNLNLIERLWKFLRKKLLSDRYCPTFSEFFSAISDFIDNLSARFSAQLSSLLSFRFEILDSAHIVRG